MKKGDTYRYRGINENISYVGPINKHRLTKEYYHRIKKIWNSELSSFNNIIALIHLQYLFLLLQSVQLIGL